MGTMFTPSSPCRVRQSTSCSDGREASRTGNTPETVIPEGADSIRDTSPHQTGHFSIAACTQNGVGHSYR